MVSGSTTPLLAYGPEELAYQWLCACSTERYCLQEVLQTIESRAVEKSGGNAVEAFDAQRLEKLVPDAS